MKKIILGLMTLLLVSNKTLAQGDKIANLLQGSLKDMNVLMKQYTDPLNKSLATCMNGNWFSTAKVHGRFGFELTFGLVAIAAPNSEQSFIFNNASYQNLKLTGSTSATSPSIFGKSVNGPEIGVVNPLYGNGTPAGTIQYLQKITLPQGGTDGNAYMALPYLQVKAAVYKGTDVAVRIIPATTISSSSGDAKVSLFGIGLTHNIKQWIPKVSLLPFDLAANLGYTMQSQLAFGSGSAKSFTVPTVGTYDSQNSEVYTGTATQNARYYNQEIRLESSAYNFNLIISKKLLFFTPFAAIGMEGGSTTLKVLGSYTAPDGVYYNTSNLLDANNGKVKFSTLKDPLNISSDYSSAAFTGGFRLDFLFVLTLNVSGTILSNGYSRANLGLGFSFR